MSAKVLRFRREESDTQQIFSIEDELRDLSPKELIFIIKNLKEENRKLREKALELAELNRRKDEELAVRRRVQHANDEILRSISGQRCNLDSDKIAELFLNKAAR